MFEDSRMLCMILTENAKLLEDGIIWVTQLWMTSNYYVEVWRELAFKHNEK
jgi:hypothetical protein